jgi:outer membrane protein insertion porin family
MYFVSDDRMNVDLVIVDEARCSTSATSTSRGTPSTPAELRSILNVRKGDVYNKKVLDSRLYMNQSGRDISSLYMDDGYLSFYPDPVSCWWKAIASTSTSASVKGKQYRIRNVIIKGNSKTNEHVIRREIRTKPGQLFNRSDVMRTQREL